MKNVSAICLSTVTMLLLTGSGLIDWRTGLVMGAGSAVGGYLGSKYSQKVSSHWLRIVIVAIGIVAVFYLARLEY